MVRAVWLVFRRSWVRIPARSWIFSMDLFLTLSAKTSVYCRVCCCILSSKPENLLPLHGVSFQLVRTWPHNAFLWASEEHTVSRYQLSRYLFGGTDYLFVRTSGYPDWQNQHSLQPYSEWIHNVVSVFVVVINRYTALNFLPHKLILVATFCLLGFSGQTMIQCCRNNAKNVVGRIPKNKCCTLWGRKRQLSTTMSILWCAASDIL